MEHDNRTLRPHVRKLCTQLLGPAPEHPHHDEIRYAPILYTEEERRQWRQQVEVSKQVKESQSQDVPVNEPAAERAKQGRRKGRGH